MLYRLEERGWLQGRWVDKAGISTVAILSLALGIGAIFSIADSVLLRPLPVERPEQLAVVLSQPPGTAVSVSAWSNPVWEQVRERRHELFETAFALS